MTNASPDHNTFASKTVISFCPFWNNETLITSFYMTMQDVIWLVFVKTFWTRITTVFLRSELRNSSLKRMCSQVSQPSTTTCTSPCQSCGTMALLKDWSYYPTPRSQSSFT
jgi:hypothetical protein